MVFVLALIIMQQLVLLMKKYDIITSYLENIALLVHQVGENF